VNPSILTGRAVVHEMRNQLAVAVANLEGWLDGKLEPTPVRIRAVLQALNALDVLIDDLYRASAQAAPAAPMHAEARIIDVCSTIENEVHALEAAAAERNVRLEYAHCRHTYDECRHFGGDPVRIGQIVKNVALNALRYTSPGGTVLIDCHRGPGCVELTIADEGPGLSAADAEHLFEPGFRGSAAQGSAVGGSGLGLSVVKRLVEDQGGRIEIVPNSAGATFRIDFPGQTLTDCAACVQRGEC
jgi:signal transduction histidine kinase